MGIIYNIVGRGYISKPCPPSVTQPRTLKGDTPRHHTKVKSHHRQLKLTRRNVKFLKNLGLTVTHSG